MEIQPRLWKQLYQHSAAVVVVEAVAAMAAVAAAATVATAAATSEATAVARQVDLDNWLHSRLPHIY